MTGAAALTGAWRRSGLIVDGVTVTDRCNVLWLQTELWYADIRLPVRRSGAQPDDDGAFAAGPERCFARPWAFAGKASWDDPVMTWHHHLDSEANSEPDSNPLERSGSLILERGRIAWEGRSVPFTEEWQRISPRDAEMCAEAKPGRITVTVGRWRIELADERPAGPFLAVRHERDESGAWRATGSLHLPADA